MYSRKKYIRGRQTCYIKRKVITVTNRPFNKSTESVSHSTVFFSHNKSANSIFYHGLSAKRTKRLHVILTMARAGFREIG